MNEVYIEGIKGKLIEVEKKNFDNRFESDRVWTAEIKASISKYGKEFGFNTYTNDDSGKHNGEYLYDLLWFEEFNNSTDDFKSRLKQVPLVLECEWGLGYMDIKYDFEKLLIAKAPLKVMICQSKEESKQILLEYFTDAVKSFGNKSLEECYLIAILDYHKSIFNFTVLKYIVFQNNI